MGILIWLSLSIGSLFCEDSSLEVFLNQIQDSQSTGAEKCSASIDRSRSQKAFQELKTSIEDACRALSNPPTSLVPTAKCCQADEQQNKARGGTKCGGYEPTSHSICLYHNSRDLSCPSTANNPDRDFEILYAEHWHALQTCLQRSGHEKYRRLPYDPSQITIEIELPPPPGKSKTSEKGTYRCGQIAAPKHQTWCLEINEKCNNPYRESPSCEEFCNNYGGTGQYEQKCCVAVCKQEQQSCCSWFEN